MGRRVFLQGLAGFGNEPTDWGNAPDDEVDASWDRLRQTPVYFTAGTSNRLLFADINPSNGGRDLTAFSCIALTAHATHQFFQTIGQEARDVLRVVLIEPDESLRRTCFAELCQSIDNANAAAEVADIPIRFCEAMRAAEKWERQVQSGEVVGMDDPVWMAKAQEKIDAALDQLWVQQAPKSR